MRFSVTALALLAAPAAMAFHPNPAAPPNAVPATALSVGSYLDALHETPTAPAAAAAQPAPPAAASNANAAASKPAAPVAPAASPAASAQTFSTDLYSAIVQPAHPQETHALSMGQEFARARSQNGHVVGYESRKPAMYSGGVTNNAMLSALVDEVCDADVNSEACQSAIAKYSEARAAWPGGMRQEFQRGRTAQGTVG